MTSAPPGFHRSGCRSRSTRRLRTARRQSPAHWAKVHDFSGKANACLLENRSDAREDDIYIVGRLVQLRQVQISEVVALVGGESRALAALATLASSGRIVAKGAKLSWQTWVERRS